MSIRHAFSSVQKIIPANRETQFQFEKHNFLINFALYSHSHTHTYKAENGDEKEIIVYFWSSSIESKPISVVLVHFISICFHVQRFAFQEHAYEVRIYGVSTVQLLSYQNGHTIDFNLLSLYGNCWIARASHSMY